jgi:hypothetical protein
MILYGFVHLTTLSVAPTVQLQTVRWLPNDRLKERGRKLGWSISRQVPKFVWRDWGQPRNTSVSLVGVRAGIISAKANLLGPKHLATMVHSLYEHRGQCSLCEAHLRYVTFRTLDRLPSSGARQKWSYSAGSVGSSSNQDHIFLRGYTKYDPGDNRKFWEELIAYFPFTVILVSDTSRKKTLVCMRNEFNKTKKFWRLQCCY